MKLVKITSALTITVVLAACSNEQPVMHTQPIQDAMNHATEQAVQQVNNIAGSAHGTGAVKVEKATDSSRTVVYRCQSGKQISAYYAFQGEEAKAVNLMLTSGKDLYMIPTLTRDTANQDFTSFTSDDYIWNLDNGFTLSTATKETTGMLTQKGKESDQILAKLCDVNKKLTTKLNK